jgi:hypothetical protein
MPIINLQALALLYLKVLYLRMLHLINVKFICRITGLKAYLGSFPLVSQPAEPPH